MAAEANGRETHARWLSLPLFDLRADGARVSLLAARSKRGCIRRRWAGRGTAFPTSRPCWPGRRRSGRATRSPASRLRAPPSGSRRRCALADLPLKVFLNEAIVPYEDDDVTRLIVDGVDATRLAPVASLTVGELRDWLLSDAATGAALAALSPGLTPEMVAAVCEALPQPGPDRDRRQAPRS